MRPTSPCPRRTSVWLLLALCLWLPVSAAATPPPQAEAVALIRQIFDRATSALEQHHERIARDPRFAEQLMERVLAPHVDFELVAQLVLAQRWREATPEQRERFTAAFRRSLLRTYATVLSEHMDEILAQLERDGELLEVTPQRSGGDARRLTVQTRMSLGKDSIAVDYALRAGENGWQAFDVIIEGVSFVISRRNEVAGLLQKQTLDELIAQLERDPAGI